MAHWLKPTAAAVTSLSVAFGRAARRHIGQLGFTLIEMAIVLIVIGLIVSGSLKLFQGVAEAARQSNTQATLRVVDQAIITYAQQNGCLPCPADGTQPPTSATYGLSLDSSATPAAVTGCVSALKTCDTNITVPVVPWLTLGLNVSDVTDAWNDLIGYQIGGNSYTGDGATCYAGTQTAVYLAKGFVVEGPITGPPAITCPPLGTLNVYPLDPSTGAVGATALTTAAVYVLVSYGADRYGAYTTNGTTIPATTNDNCSQSQEDNTAAVGSVAKPFVQGNAILQMPTTPACPAASGIYFDDIVIYRTGPAAAAKCGAGACGNPAAE